MSPLESQVRSYGPLILAVTGLALTGTFINQDPGETTVLADKDFNCNMIALNTPKNVSAHWTSGLVIGLSVILPLLPLTKSDEKIPALMSHALGQSSTFASNEFIKHFLVSPDQSFFKKCNTSVQACNERNLQSFPLKTFCDNTTIPIGEVFASLHSMPDIVFSMLGSSAMLFVANVYMWKSKNVPKNIENKKISYFKITIVLFFSLLTSVAIIYQYRQSQNTADQLMASFLYGAGLQFLIFIMFQFKTTPAVDKENDNSPIIMNILKPINPTSHS